MIKKIQSREMMEMKNLQVQIRTTEINLTKRKQKMGERISDIDDTVEDKNT